MNPPTISVVRGRVGLPAPQSSSVAFAPQRFATHAGSRRRSTISRPLTRTSHEPAETQMRRVRSCLDPRAGAGGHRASRYVPEMRRRTCPGRRGAAWFGVSDRIDGRDVDMGALPRGSEARTAARGALSTPDRWGCRSSSHTPPRRDGQRRQLTRSSVVMATHYVGDHSNNQVWRCTACRADWVRPAEEPLHNSERCLNCDGLLVPIEPQGIRKARGPGL